MASPLLVLWRREADAHKVLTRITSIRLHRYHQSDYSQVGTRQQLLKSLLINIFSKTPQSWHCQLSIYQFLLTYSKIMETLWHRYNTWSSITTYVVYIICTTWQRYFCQNFFWPPQNSRDPCNSGWSAATVYVGHAMFMHKWGEKPLVVPNVLRRFSMRRRRAGSCLEVHSVYKCSCVCKLWIHTVY